MIPPMKKELEVSSKEPEELKESICLQINFEWKHFLFFLCFGRFARRAKHKPGEA
jgi:hypothetical protein